MSPSRTAAGSGQAPPAELLDDPTDRGWGLWGGPPGGWCKFKVATNAVPSGWYHAGTRQEAEAGRAEFHREMGLCPSSTDDRRTYEVVRFDLNREPIGEPGRPTAAQRRALVLIGQGASRGRLAINRGEVRRETLCVLRDRGWVHFPPHVGDFVLTALGRILEGTSER